MENLIEWAITTLSKDGSNSKKLVKTAFEEMTLDDWYMLRNECNAKIAEAGCRGVKLETNPNIMLLKSYRSDMYQCSLLKREIDALSNFVKEPVYTGMPFTPAKCSNPVEQRHIALIDAKHKLESLLAHKGAKLEKCISMIEKVSDSRGKYILTALFIDNKDMMQIMQDAPFDLCYKQIYRIKKAALDEIRKMEV